MDIEAELKAIAATGLEEILILSRGEPQHVGMWNISAWQPGSWHGNISK